MGENSENIRKPLMKSFYSWFTFFCCAVLGFGSWLYLIESGPLWRDEIATLAFTKAGSPQEILREMPYNTVPVLLPFMIQGFGLFTDSHEGFKNFAFGLGLAPILFLCLVMVKNDPRMAAVLGLLMVSCWQSLRWTASLRSYGLGLLAMFIFLFSVKKTDREKISAWQLIGSSLFAAMSSYQNLPILVGVLGANIIFFWHKKDSKNTKETLIYILGLGLGLGVALLHLPALSKSREIFTVMQFPELGISDVVGRFLSSFWKVNPLGTSLVLLLFLGNISYLFTLKRALLSNSGILRCIFATILGLFFTLIFLGSSKVVLYEWQFVLPTFFLSFQAAQFFTLTVQETKAEKSVLTICLVFSLLQAKKSWDYLHQRTTSLDLVARHIEQKAGEKDIIIFNPWEPVISFAYYYRGSCKIYTVPPVSRYDTHRFDEVQKAMEKANQPFFGDVSEEITKTLSTGGRVWLLGDFTPPPSFSTPFVVGPAPNLSWGWKSGPYYQMWSEQLALTLMAKASFVTDWTPEIVGKLKIIPYENPRVLTFYRQ